MIHKKLVSILCMHINRKYTCIIFYKRNCTIPKSYPCMSRMLTTEVQYDLDAVDSISVVY